MTRQLDDIQQQLNTVPWYHTIDLGNGITTPGAYDHRPYLDQYGIPSDLTGKRVLDIGAASGFFSFEMERYGAEVTAVDLPRWYDHDFGPNYQPDQKTEDAEVYLREPFEIAHRILGSKVQKKFMNIYDLSPSSVGEYDLTFCGSLLIHLTDPVKALWNIASVTRQKAIIATPILQDDADRPLALMVGHHRGDGWWIPTRSCLELMAVAAGFTGIEWYSEFRLDFRDGSPGPYHGVLHAYKTPSGWTEKTKASDDLKYRPIPPSADTLLSAKQQEITHLQNKLTELETLVHGYENGRFMRSMRWLRRQFGG